jgi:putative multiple sugar transport system ATP-binding protein
MSQYILEMDHITKEFPGVKALSDVTFKVKKGEIHCLVGENGAGKSTLMKVLSGVYPYGTYTGNIIFNGDASLSNEDGIQTAGKGNGIQKFNGISDSEKAGIAIIYQELALFPELTVYENIFMGHEIKKGALVNWNETITKAQAALKKIKLDINPATKIKELGVGKQQLVEITKALCKDVKLLILDEPTAALNENDSENLLFLMKELKEQGITCIMISHKLKEVISVADTVTVLRDGKTICSLDREAGEISETTIIKHMVGRDIEDIYPKRPDQKIGEKAIEVQDWNVYDGKLGRKTNKDVNFHVRKGEIVGIAGLMGSGRTELAQSIFGNPKNCKVTGTILIDGKEMKPFKHPKNAIDAGIAYVTEDRKGDGLILIQDIKNNITISNLAKLSRGGIINQNEEVVISNDYLKNINIKAPSIAQTVGHLSGGNQQKVSLAKWLFTSPNILILDEPTRGIDVGAKYEIYTFMNALVDRGMSIIMISSELPEVLGMSDRVYVMAGGKITGELNREEASQERVMEMATV